MEHDRGPFNGLAEIAGSVLDPIGAMVAGARITVRESRSEEERRLDIPGLILGTSALFSVTYGLIEANVRPAAGGSHFPP